MNKFKVAASVVCLTSFLSVQASSNTDKKYWKADSQMSSAIMLAQNQPDSFDVRSCLYKQTGPDKAFVKKEISKDWNLKRAIKTHSKVKRELAKLNAERDSIFEVKAAAIDKDLKDGGRAYSEKEQAYKLNDREVDVGTREYTFRNNLAGDKERDTNAFNTDIEKGEQKPLDNNNKEGDKPVYNEKVIESKGNFNRTGKETAT